MSCLCCFVHLQEIEINKAQWSALFEPYQFFEAYKNYLQVDIIAADADDMLAWKGWVESRLRLLTLKVKSFFNFCRMRSQLHTLSGYYVYALLFLLNIYMFKTGGMAIFLGMLSVCLCADREGHAWDAAVPSLSA